MDCASSLVDRNLDRQCRRWSRESAAALVGGAAILQGVIYNLHPINGNYEFGPLLAATFMTTQATIGLVYAARTWEFAQNKNE